MLPLPYQFEHRLFWLKLIERPSSPVGAFVSRPFVLCEVEFQVVNGSVFVVAGVERGKLVGSIHVALHCRRLIEILASRVVQFLHCSSDVEKNNWGTGVDTEGFPETNQRGLELPSFEEV